MRDRVTDKSTGDSLTTAPDGGPAHSQHACRLQRPDDALDDRAQRGRDDARVDTDAQTTSPSTSTSTYAAAVASAPEPIACSW